MSFLVSRLFFSSLLLWQISWKCFKTITRYIGHIDSIISFVTSKNRVVELIRREVATAESAHVDAIFSQPNANSIPRVTIRRTV
jgi:hypothetical protein